MVKNFSKLMSLGVLASALVGCGDQEKDYKTAEYRSTQRTIKVLKINVKQGDSIEQLLAKEFSATDYSKFNRLSYTNPYHFQMLGDSSSGDKPSNPDSTTNIIYKFELKPILKILNPGRFDKYDVSKTNLLIGEKINFPDFSDDNTIGGRPGIYVGNLILEGKRNIKTDEVNKKYSFQK